MNIFLFFLMSIFILFILVLYIWSLVWVYSDAKKRGKPAGLVTLVVALLKWPISILLWLIIRPDNINSEKV